MLVNLRQEKDESLCSFMERFSIMAVKIRDLNLEVALYSMIMTLKPKLFSNNLCKMPLALMDELRAKASGQAPSGDESQKGKGNLEKADKQERQGRRCAKAQVPGLYPLTTSRVALLEEAFNAELIMFHPLPPNEGRCRGLTKPNTISTIGIMAT
ncbi:hypothetical protein CR513_05158, partial [Mucuna pruriens]